MIDTSDKVVPGAWDRLWEDFQRWPPAMIIDTGGARGYLKYPLNRQTRLWDLVQHDFAQVEMGAETSWGVRLFRRLLRLCRYVWSGFPHQRPHCPNTDCHFR